MDINFYSKIMFPVLGFIFVWDPRSWLQWEHLDRNVLEKAEMSFYSAYLDLEIEQLLHYIFFIST